MFPNVSMLIGGAAYGAVYVSIVLTAAMLIFSSVISSSMKKNVIVAVFVIVFGFAGVFLLSSYLEHNRITVSELADDEDLAVQGKN